MLCSNERFTTLYTRKPHLNASLFMHNYIVSCFVRLVVCVGMFLYFIFAVHVMVINTELNPNQ